MEKEITSVVFSFIKHEFTTNATAIYKKAIDNYKKLDGCNGIEMFVNTESRTNFMIISKWKSIEYREKYLKSEFHTESINKLKKYRLKEPIFMNFENFHDEKS